MLKNNKPIKWDEAPIVIITRAKIGGNLAGYVPSFSYKGKRIKGDFSLISYKGALEEVNTILETYTNPVRKIFSVSADFKSRLSNEINKAGLKNRPLWLCIEVLDEVGEPLRYEYIFLIKDGGRLDISKAVLTPEEVETKDLISLMWLLAKKRVSVEDL